MFVQPSQGVTTELNISFFEQYKCIQIFKQTLNSRTLIDVSGEKKKKTQIGTDRSRNFAKLIEAVNINKLKRLMG